MKKLMTKHFSKWASKQDLSLEDLSNALDEVANGSFEADLGGSIFKKRVWFQGQGKSGSGRTIICYKRGDHAFFIHGFAKNEKSNLTLKELKAFKELAKILLGLSSEALKKAINNGDFIEVESWEVL